MTNDTTIDEALHDPVLGPEVLRDCAKQLAAIVNTVHLAAQGIANTVLLVAQGWNILELLELQAECQASSINDIPLTALVRRYRAKQATSKPKRGAPRALTSEEERKVLEMVQQGMTYKEIAERMGASVSTIKRIVQRTRPREL